MESDFCSDPSRSGEVEEFGKGEGDSKLEKVEFDLEPLKTPWVPAPAKTTLPAAPKERHRNSSKGLGSQRRGRSYERVRRHASKTTSVSRTTDLPYKLKKAKPKEQRNFTDFKLRTKGSLIDVSAALNDKREKLVGLWKENLPMNNSLLLIELEKANVLALEASKELDGLQKTIRDMQKKADLTDEDNARLDIMRNEVMLKLDAFESSNTRVENLKRSLKGRSEISEIDCSISEPDLALSNSSDEEGFGGLPSSMSQPDLSKLDEEYGNLSPKTSLESTCPQALPKKSETVSEDKNQAFLATYYVNKIKSLEEKILEQDERLGEFRKNIYELQSHSSYDLSTLKADLKDKFEQLEPLPELLFLTEQRLGESLQARVKLEEQIKQKDEKFSQVTSQLVKFEVEMREMRDKMNAAELEMKNLNQNIHKLKTYNASLRTELKMLVSRKDHITHTSQCAPAAEYHPTHSSLLLNDKIKELERDLVSAKREAHFFKETKDKLEDQTEKRLEELRGSLEDSRHRNRLYQSQITFIRSSYHNLFPVEIFSPTSGRRPHDKLQSPNPNKGKKGSTEEIQKEN